MEKQGGMQIKSCLRVDDTCDSKDKHWACFKCEGEREKEEEGGGIVWMSSAR